MRIQHSLIALFAIVFFASCHSENDKTPTTAITDSSSAPKPGIESRESFFYKQTMDIHNDVMSRMGKLKGYEKRVLQQTDSIRTMLASTDFTKQMAQRMAGDLDSLDRLGKNLQAADSAMNTWMEQFNPDPQLANSDANADYFEDQKKKAEMMKKMFFEALGEADKKFGGKNQ